MSFWKSRTGTSITGDEASSFAGNSGKFRSLPDNTIATAMIKNASLNEYNGEKCYQIVYGLVDGDFKGAEVKQRISPFDIDDKRAERNLNMFMRLFKLCDIKLTHDEAPTDIDMAPLRGKLLCIKIGNGIIQGQDRTWVREVHLSGTLETITGNTQIRTVHPELPVMQTQSVNGVESALTRNKNVVPEMDDDIPF